MKRLLLFLFVLCSPLTVLRAASTDPANLALSDKEVANLVLTRAHAVHLLSSKGEPLTCNIGYDVLNLVRVDEARETYTIDFYTWVGWKDSRLAFDPKEFGVDRVNIPPSVAWDEDRLWNPNIEFMNLVETKVTEQSLRLESSGYCRLTIRQTGTFKFASDGKAFKRFPFDKQNLPITIESFRWDRDHLRFAIEGGEHTYHRNELAKLEVSEWKVLGGKTRLSQEQYAGDPAPFARTNFTLSIQREPGFYLWKVCFPLLILVIIAIAVPWIPHNELESRMILSVTTLVAITTYSIVINADLPKLPYLTVIDLWMLWSFLVSAFGALENVAISQIAHQGNGDVHLKLDYHTRWLVPLVYLVGLIAIVIAYR